MRGDVEIRMDGGGELAFSRPQGAWYLNGPLPVATYAGQQMLICPNDEKGGFDLHYLGFESGPYVSMQSAQSEAAHFAMAVLVHMTTLITGTGASA